MSSFPPEYLSNVSARQVARRVGQKNLFCNQNFKNDKIYSKFARTWSEGPSSNTMLSQGSVFQYLESNMPFSPPRCFLGACSSVMQLLSWSYDECVRHGATRYVSSVCLIFLEMRNWCLFFNAKCVPKEFEEL